jgi:intracellular multiplication protein IcmL
MSQDALETIMMRNHYYHENYVQMTIMSLLLVILAIGLGTLAYTVKNSCPTHVYFPTTNSGTILKLPPLNKAHMTTKDLLAWSKKTAIMAYSYNFVNYRVALSSLRNYFTAAGYEGFIKALLDSNNLQGVRDKKWVVSAVATNEPKLLEEGNTGDGPDALYIWRVELPMLVTYQNSKAEQLRRQEVKVTMTITRVSTLEAADGIGIAQFIVEVKE